MPIVCIVRENRTAKRGWKAKAVARVYCKALEEGVPRADIEAEVAKCAQGERRTPQEEAQALAVAEAALLSTNTVLDNELSVLGRMLTVLGILAALGRFIVRVLPAPAKVAVGGAVALKELAESRLKTIAAQKAANDEAIAIIRRAAANAERFRQAAGG